MNDKTAKKLRRTALDIARAQNTQRNTGKKEGEYEEIIAFANYVEATEKRKKNYVPLKEGVEPDPSKHKLIKGKWCEAFDISLGTVKLDPFCVKGIYRNLKKWYKKRERGEMGADFVGVGM